MNPDDDELGEPFYIECDGDFMECWLPVGVHPDDLNLDWCN